MSASDLIKLLHAEQGIVSCVGAGGKKSTMFRLAEAHPGRVGITATAHIEFFPSNLEATSYIGDENALLQAIESDNESRKIAFAKPSSRFGRRAGINPENVNQFMQAGQFDLMVIKADGARGRFIKAPSAHEPVLSRYSNTVIPVLSVKVIGEPVHDGIVHRVDAFTRVTGLKEGEEIKPEHVARLLSSEQGCLKDVGQANVVPLINMVDDIELEQIARLVAAQALQMTDRFDRVVLAAMKKADPIVAVIER